MCAERVCEFDGRRVSLKKRTEGAVWLGLWCLLRAQSGSKYAVYG